MITMAIIISTSSGYLYTMTMAIIISQERKSYTAAATAAPTVPTANNSNN
jgi:hypothetical protein